ncbi:MAG: aldo/keto reductase [Bacteroidales bacterium]|nr:aldo/keto reductase [Bacteroidales bacterium]
MFYNSIQDTRLSALGFGAMRLPTLPDGGIDRDTVFAMVDEAIAQGVNYFDTAFPYHDGYSEQVLGAALARHPREKWHLADKFPGHQHYDVFDPAGVFECQLRRCGVDYFDFYLYHNICENSIADYMDPRWGILEYFVEQREKGRIRHLGLSCHSTPSICSPSWTGLTARSWSSCRSSSIISTGPCRMPGANARSSATTAFRSS